MDAPKLENQLCFPLYLVSKGITNMYRPFLEELDLTYSQYLVLMVLWEQDGIAVHEIGKKLFLDSGTLTPLLKRLELKEILLRKRKKEDERVVAVFLTEKGNNLRQKACEIPKKMQDTLGLSQVQFTELKQSIQTLLTKLKIEK